jgi:hypothetical protein
MPQKQGRNPEDLQQLMERQCRDLVCVSIELAFPTRVADPAG